MMNFGKMPVGRAASRLARVVSKNEPTLQRTVRAASMNGMMSTMSGLSVSQVAPRLAVAQLPAGVRQLSSATVSTAQLQQQQQRAASFLSPVLLSSGPGATCCMYVVSVDLDLDQGLCRNVTMRTLYLLPTATSGVPSSDEQHTDRWLKPVFF